MTRRHKIKLILLLVYVFLAVVLVYFFRPIYLFSILLVLLPPAMVNFLWLKQARFKIIAFTAATTLLFAPPVELAARLANAWDVQSLLPRLFGWAPLENLIFAGLNFFWVLSFYEYFVNGDKAVSSFPRFKWLLGLYALFSAVFYLIFFLQPAWAALSYFNLSLLILFIPGVIIFSCQPALLKKVWLPTLFFALVFFIYEAVSLVIGSWWWPGEYLWPVTLFGHRFPLDDVIIWYFISTPVLIGGYDFFMNDKE